MFARVIFPALAALGTLVPPARTAAQVVSCSQVAGVSATVPTTANSYNGAGTVAMALLQISVLGEEAGGCGSAKVRQSAVRVLH
jgi:hypothetical protein